MKMTIALAAVLLSAGSVMAQSPDSIPQANPQLSLDTAVRKTDTKVDTVTKRAEADSNVANWKQDSTLAGGNASGEMKSDEKLSDRVVMKDGELMVIKNGEVSRVEKAIILPSGTVIQKDGTLKKKDGTEVKLKNGQFIELPAASSTKKKKSEKSSR